MIYSVRGKLIYSQNETVVVECAGVGYECRTSFSTIQAVAGKDEVMLYTHLSVREDAVELFGFATKEELKSFRMLIGVSGVGPKAAISILSSCTPSQFALAVATGDSASFTKIKGIGAKTAQRIVLELKDKVASQDRALFAAYYIVGSKEDLIEAGVISKGGLFKSAKVSYEAEKTSFIKIDYREISTINTNSQKAKVLSNHRKGTYSIEEVDGEAIINISDPAGFWEQTKYLVIQTQ